VIRHDEPAGDEEQAHDPHRQETIQSHTKIPPATFAYIILRKPTDKQNVIYFMISATICTVFFTISLQWLILNEIALITS
jgi:hypothetical protein